MKNEIVKDFIASRENHVPMIGAFGYGSGFFHQKGYSLQKESMLDLIFIVKNEKEWHKENKRRNAQDYPFNAKILLGNINIDRLSFLNGVSYLTHVPFEGKLFKYGVASEEAFLDQLTSWSSFFLPGRFQKPVFPFRSTKEISEAIYQNRKLALLISLYTLPYEMHTLKGLYCHLCSLSYLGDIRMWFVENPNKISNIVEAEFPLFEKIYGTNTTYFKTKEDGRIIIFYDQVYQALEEMLPNFFSGTMEEPNRKRILKFIEEKNKKESISQPLLGLATAGPVTSLKYIHEKMLKKEKQLRKF